MKCFQGVKPLLIALTTGLLSFILLPIRAQGADIPDAVIARALSTAGADASALQLVDTNSPFQYEYGTYWSVQKDSWAPLPFNWLFEQDGISVYSAGPGVFLVDDRTYDYDSEALARTIFSAMDMDGGGGDGGTPLYSTNDLWLELASTSILSPTNLAATLVVHTPEIDGVYDLFFKTNLLPGDAWYWVARGLPGQTNFYLVNLPADGGFFILGTTNGTDTNGLTAAYRGLIGGTETLTNDFDQDGLSDAWEINFFGDLSQSPFADYDGDGVSNYGSYTNLNDGEPNKIQFFLNFPAERVNSNPASASLNIRGGNPSYYAVLVNNTNRAAATWQLFNSTNIPVSLSSGDGQYSIQIGLRGRASGAQETWLGAQLTLDTVPPVVAVTNPTSSVTSWPLIQLQGWANEPVSKVSFDITNPTGLTTNLSGYVTSQVADTNLLQFTTNYFQCYDLPLATGTNRITLRVTDLAGNTTTTNLTLRLDYSVEVSSPGLTILWPPNGTQIAADTFTVQAQVDNPTAKVEGSIVDNANNTNTVQGIIERNGLVWVKNMPLAAGTNTLVLTATSAAGHATSSSISVIRSSVNVTLNPLSTNQFNKPSVNLSGTVSSPSDAVWVNGVQATVDGSGTWEADSVSASPSGTALFDIEVYGPGSGPPSGTPIASLEVDQPQPAQVVLMSYSGTRDNSTTVTACIPRTQTDEAGDDVKWTYDSGGFYRFWFDGDQQNPPNDTTESLSPGQGSINPPWETASVSVGIAGPSGCTYDWIAEDRRTETRMMIEPEGQSPLGETRLYLVRAKALQFALPTVNDGFYSHGDLLNGARSYAGTIPIAPDTLQINGATSANTGETDADGATWGATLVPAPAGVRPQLLLAATQVQGYKDYTSDFKVDPVKPSIMVNGVKLASDRVVSNANFIVGQMLTFSTNDLQLPTNLVSRTVQWTFEGHFLNDSNQPCPDCSVDYTTNSAKLTNDTTTAWWVSGANPAVTYVAQLTETFTLNNGSNATVSAKGLFSMLRPLPDFHVEIRDQVRVGTNFGLNGQIIPGFRLQFGRNTPGSNTDVGIAYVFTNSPINPATSQTYGRYFITQVIDLFREQYNVRSGANCAGTQLQDTAGLDTENPYQGYKDDANGEWTDAPGGGLTSASWLSITNTFTSYFMFQPRPYDQSTAPVPMFAVDWAWSGRARTNGPPDSWQLIPDSGQATVHSGETNGFPTWTHTMTGASIENSATNVPCFDEN